MCGGGAGGGIKVGRRGTLEDMACGWKEVAISFFSLSLCFDRSVSFTLFLLQAVQQVVTNLQIGHIELRNEDSDDIQRYVHERKVEKIVVPLEGEIAEVKTNFLKVKRSF